MKRYLPLIHKAFENKFGKPLTQYNFNFPYGGVILLLLLLLLIFFIVYSIKISKKEKEKEEKEAIREAIRRLEIKYLKGEISFEEYERLKKDLLKSK